MVHKKMVRRKKEDAYFKRICAKASTRDKIVKRPKQPSGFRGEDSQGLYYKIHYYGSGSYWGSGSYRFGSMSFRSYRGSGSFSSGSGGAFGLLLGGYGLELI